MPNLWFCPNIGAADTLDLFRQPDAWSDARARIDTFQFYAQNIMASREVDMTAHPNWELVGPNTFQALLDVQAFRKLADWNIKVALEIGAVKPGDCDAMKNADLTICLIKRIQEAGGTVDYVAMDEPLPSSKSATWENMMPGLGCNLTVQDAATATVNYCKKVTAACPGVSIGLIEAYPNSRATDLLKFVQCMSEGGFHPQFLHLDVDRNALKKNVDDRLLASEMDQIGSVCQKAPIPYGQILWGQMFKSDVQYRDSVMTWAAKIQRFKVQPDTLIVQSWEALNGVKNLPKNLPPSYQCSHTHLLGEIAQQFGVAARAT
jgi:hypothetical protein